jgi:hypothetical protein
MSAKMRKATTARDDKDADRSHVADALDSPGEHGGTTTARLVLL